MMDYTEIFSKINLRVEQILEHLAFLRYFDENPHYLEENVDFDFFAYFVTRALRIYARYYSSIASILKAFLNVYGLLNE